MHEAGTVTTAPSPARPSLTDRAYEAIREDILFHVLAPGTLITEGALVEQYGIGKTPIREALVKLAREGLIVSHPRKGHEIAPLTLAHAQELFFVRKLLEPAAAKLAATRGVDADALDELDALGKVAVDPRDHASIAAFVKANTAFHLGVAAASGSTQLTRMLRDVIEQLDRYVYLGITLSPRAGGHAHEHGELLDALRAGDAQRAADSALQQVEWTERAIVSAMLDTPAIRNASLSA